MNPRSNRPFLLVLSVLALASPTAYAEDEHRPVRALLVTGGCCHDYGKQKGLLPQGVSARAAVEWTVVHQGGSSTSSKIPLYDDPEWAEGFDVVVHNECFADARDPEWCRKILAPHRAGTPAVVIHCAMHCYRNGTDEWFEFLGVTSRRHGGHYPFEAINLQPKDPVMKTFGKSWKTPKGELYLIEKLWPNTTPLAHAMSRDSKKNEVCVWKSLYGQNRTRVFGTTIGHHNETLSEHTYLDLITRGLLWSVDRLDEKLIRTAAKPKKSKVTIGNNLALGKRGSASTVQKGRPVTDAFDGSIDSRWCANDNSAPQFLQVDLGRPEKITACKIIWEFDGRRYRHKISCSSDGKTWKTHVDHSQTNEREQQTIHRFEASDVRYVRIDITGVESGAWSSIWEMEVWGTELQEIEVFAKRGLKKLNGSLLERVKVPEGFEASLFAAPPDISYPAALCSSADGAVFVSVDKNSSLGRGKGMGKIVRCVDVNGDGVADEFTDFVPAIESPRGSFFDGKTLYVIHQPFLSAFRDTDDDGVADESEVLVRGIGFTLKSRPADHTSNGVRMGIDGWLYLAIGDFGFREAIGKDGAKLQLHGGGVVRVRPDGTELELFAFGTRNIYDVAVSPLLDCFTRDNTNDGGGWDIRLSHIHQLGWYGYPSLFKRFGDEVIQPLAIYGTGSGTAALWLSEPGFPDGYGNSLYTCDWGKNRVYRHPLAARSSTFEPSQDTFVEIPRPTDLDVDASGRVTIASWHGGQYRYGGPKVGFLVQLRPEGARQVLKQAPSSAALAAVLPMLASDSHALRLAAQRQLLRHFDASFSSRLEALARGKPDDPPLRTRVAAMWTLAQATGRKARLFLEKLSRDPAMREHALRALTDRRTQLDGLSPDLFLESLGDENPRVRRQALVSLARLGDSTSTAAILPLSMDADPIIAHTAVKALVALRAVDVCVDALESVDGKFADGASRVLRELHDPKVITRLIEAPEKTQNDARRRRVLSTLIRLYFREADWGGDSWGTRPDTTGPYFRRARWEGSDRVGAALRKTLESADHATARFLLEELAHHRVELDGTLPLLERLALKSPDLAPLAIDRLTRRKKIDTASKDFYEQVARSTVFDYESRTRAVDGLARHDAARLPAIYADATSVKGRHRAQILAAFLRAAAEKRVTKEVRASIIHHVRADWKDDASAADLLLAVAQARSAQFKTEVSRYLNDPRADVRDSAILAASALGIEIPESVAGKKGPTVANLSFEAVSKGALARKGDRKLGAQIFQRQRCIDCHTVSRKEKPKGPFLGGIATRYSRAELIESVVKPSAKVAQGFATQLFVLTTGKVHQGFVTREAGDEVELRDQKGQPVVIAKTDILERKHVEGSAMPNGLIDGVTLDEFAAILAYLESLQAK